MKATNKSPKRVAIYCRVSSDEKLDMSFNSLDAQRLAGEAYITSQQAEGWGLVPTRYDDPGFSGGNVDRPALKNLLFDIQKHQVDIVLVYKVDRLSRSIADFSKLVQEFDAHNVTFASMTQPINSGDSMGRLMLNVLLSFAQFEREVTTERIKDKISASKKLGMWMGGHVPLGFDVVDRKLVINEAEASLVRRIYTDFVVSKSCTEISHQLEAEGIKTKAHKHRGELRPGNRFDQKYLNMLLRNRIYIGEIGHSGTWYKGQHEAIISKAIWDKVQAIIAKDAYQRGIETKQRKRTDVLLRGILYTPTGEKMRPTFTNKSGKRYQYYISTGEQKFGAASKTHDRLPCDVVDGAVTEQVKSILSSPEAIQAVWHQLQTDGSKIDKVNESALGRLAEVWDSLFQPEKHRIVQLMVERVDLVAGGISVSWRKLGWKELIGEFNTTGNKALALEVA
jgi:DNA invertase Pin-like site-specific DNA recombinase